jgi:hypothetical protein
MCRSGNTSQPTAVRTPCLLGTAASGRTPLHQADVLPLLGWLDDALVVGALLAWLLAGCWQTHGGHAGGTRAEGDNFHPDSRS